MEKFESERNTAFSAILGLVPRIHTKHLSNVILGFIPRIHIKHYSLDTWVRLFVTPEYDGKMVKNIFPKKNDHTNLRPQCAPDTTGFLSDVYKRSTRAQKTHTLETAESGVDKVVSSYEKNPNVHKAYMNFLRQRKTALDAPLHAVSSGRSMIEMLGVLAIIGVLSVGGIQGFSKAMETYQSHKQLEQINSLIYHILELRDTFKQDYRNQSTTRINDLMGAISALGYLPDDMKLISNETAQDRFGNKFILSYGVDTCRQPDGSLSPCNSTSFYLGISLKTINNAFAISSENQCKNLIKSLTAFDAENGNISRLELKNNYTTDVIIWGKIYCTNSQQNCFKNMTPIKMTQFCKSCTTEDHCVLVLYFIP